MEDRPVINFGANFVFKQAVRIRLVQGWEEPVNAGYTSLPGPGGARAEAERRRSVLFLRFPQDNHLSYLSCLPLKVKGGTTKADGE